MNSSDDGELIICAGGHIGSECVQVMSGFPYRFVMSEWLSEDQFRLAALLWIVDGSAPWDAVYSALSHGIPMLVPEDNAAMQQLCRDANCGIWYRNGMDVQRCLESLLGDNAMREQLGANGKAYFASSKACGR